MGRRRTSNAELLFKAATEPAESRYVRDMPERALKRFKTKLEDIRIPNGKKRDEFLRTFAGISKNLLANVDIQARIPFEEYPGQSGEICRNGIFSSS